jgi:hypothetical protein
MRENGHARKMFDEVDTRVPRAAEQSVSSVYHDMFPAGDRSFVPRAFEWAGHFFSGQTEEYQAIDARYHDFEHTLQGTLCLARLLHGRHEAKAMPVLSQKAFELGLLAILFHDTGYLKKKDDVEGTGAKYTPTHVARSAAVVKEFLSRKGWAVADTTAIQNMIRCTGVNVDLKAIPFQNSEERMVGFALGTADLLGQMAAGDYIEKLPILYEEFAEAERFGGPNSGWKCPFTSSDDLIRKTPAFWEGYVRTKIETDFERLYTFLNKPYPDGPNEYVRRVEHNIGRLRRTLKEEPG